MTSTINNGMMCWTCCEKPATHSTFRDALGEDELTCDKCHREEYPEQYEEPQWEVKCNNCDNFDWVEECPKKPEDYRCDDCGGCTTRTCGACWTCCEKQKCDVIYYFLENHTLTQTSMPFDPKIHEWESELEVDGRTEKTFKMKEKKPKNKKKRKKLVIIY